MKEEQRGDGTGERCETQEKERKENGGKSK